MPSNEWPKGLANGHFDSLKDAFDTLRGVKSPPPLPPQINAGLKPGEIPGRSGWGQLNSPGRLVWTAEGAVNLDEVDRRVAQTRAEVSRLGPLAAGFWLNRVKPGGTWDDKVHGGKSDMSREGMGNASYGATAAALGLPNYVARNGAGIVQAGQNAWRAAQLKPPAPSNGLPGVIPPFGDDERDDKIVSAYHRYRPAKP